VELGVFYRRYPWRPDASVTVVERCFSAAHAGHRIWNSAVAHDERAHYRRYTGTVPAPFVALIGAILARFSDRIHMCRFDVTCESYADLFAGRFQILECNGSMAYDLGFWAMNVPWAESWASMGRWTLDHLLIGFYNVLTLRCAPLGAVADPSRVATAVRCNDWEKLLEYGHM
jgi:hypothetical protein